MSKKSKKFLTCLLVFSMVVTQVLFSSVAFASTRYSGEDRYQTALDIVKNGWSKSDTAIIARGDDEGLADALSAAPLAYAKGQAPILLTEPAKLYDGVLDELKALDVKTVYIVGGPGAVSTSVENELKVQFGTGNVKRLYGDDRVATSVAIAKELPSFTEAVLANAYSYADALSVSSIAAHRGAPILLTDKDTVTDDVLSLLNGKTVYAIGGYGVISDKVVEQTNAERIDGIDRFETNASVLEKFTPDYSKVYLANGADENAADSLAGSALAAKTNSPIVLVEEGSVKKAESVLKAGLKEDSEVYILGGEGVLAKSAADAVEALRPVTPAELKVESVTALNLRQIAVKFNKTVDKDTATDVDNYKLDTEGKADLDGANFELLDDDRTVLVTLAADKIAEQQETVKLTVEDVEDTDGNVLEKTDIDNIEFIDTKLPIALDAQVIGKNTIKVTFDEPVTADKDSFEINGGELHIKSVTTANNDTEANIVLYSDLEDGEMDVKVLAKAEDFAGFTVISKSFTVNVVEDAKAPKVIGYKDASPEGVTLVFNEEIALEDGDVDNFYHTNKNNTIDDAITSKDIDGRELKLDFSDNNLPKGTAYVYIEEGSLKDLWDNENDDISVKVEVEVDTTKPEVKDIEVKSEDQIEVKFSENVTDVEKSDFTVTDSDREKVSIKSVSASDDTVTINFRDELSGDYSIAIEGIEDEAGNEIAKTEETFTVDDLTDPDFDEFTATLYNAGKEDQKLKVDFNEEMSTDGKYSIDDIDKYTVGSYVLSELDSDVSLKVVDNGKGIEITIPSKADDSDNGIDLKADTGSTKSLKIARVADAAGNYTAALSGSVKINASGTVDITKFEATDVDTVEVTFDDELKDFDAEDLIVYVDDNGTDGYQSQGTADSTIDVAKVNTELDDDGNTVATLTLASDLGYDAKVDSRNVRIATISKPESKNDYNEHLAAITKADGKYTAQDSIVPEIAEDDDDVQQIFAYDTNNNGKVDTVVVEYTEAIDSTTVSKHTFSADDITVDNTFASNKGTAAEAAVESGSSSVDGKYIVVKLDETDSDLPTDAEFEPDVAQSLTIYDLAQNVLEGSTELLPSINTAAED